jgi:hypothetical protein
VEHDQTVHTPSRGKLPPEVWYVKLPRGSPFRLFPTAIIPHRRFWIAVASHFLKDEDFISTRQ